MSIKTTLQTITPKDAERLLGMNDCNRAIKSTRIARLSAVLNSGQWQFNGETIKVSVSGHLLDGQHRLAAVLFTGVSIETLVVEGLADKVMRTIDTGSPRRMADLVSMDGHSDPTRVAAGATLLWKVITGSAYNNPPPQPSYALDVLSRYPTISKWARLYNASKVIKRIIPSASLIPALVYLEEIAKQPALAEALFHGLSTGENLQDGNPILALRNRMISFKTDGRYKKAQSTTNNIWPAVVRTINALETGKQVFAVKLTDENGPVSQPALLNAHLRHETALRRLTDLAPGIRTEAHAKLADKVGRTSASFTSKVAKAA